LVRCIEKIDFFLGQLVESHLNKICYSTPRFSFVRVFLSNWTFIRKIFILKENILYEDAVLKGNFSILNIVHFDV